MFMAWEGLRQEHFKFWYASCFEEEFDQEGLKHLQKVNQHSHLVYDTTLSFVLPQLHWIHPLLQEPKYQEQLDAQMSCVVIEQSFWYAEITSWTSNPACSLHFASWFLAAWQNIVQVLSCVAGK